MLQWSSAYETGYEPIDREHRKLVEHVNAFGQALANGIGRDRLGEMLTFLEKYSAGHFAHEEACMQRFKCPAAQANLAAHENFRREMQRVRSFIYSDGATTKAAISLHQGLCRWLRNHILKVDSHLGKCVPREAGAALR